MSARRGYFERGDFDPRNQIPHPTREDTYAVSVTVDSSERDKTIYPDSNSFAVSLPTDIKNVLSVELKGWNPPKTEYNVHAGNNKIDFQIYLEYFDKSIHLHNHCHAQALRMCYHPVQMMGLWQIQSYLYELKKLNASIPLNIL